MKRKRRDKKGQEQKGEKGNKILIWKTFHAVDGRTDGKMNRWKVGNREKSGASPSRCYWIWPVWFWKLLVTAQRLLPGWSSFISILSKVYYFANVIPQTKHFQKVRTGRTHVAYKGAISTTLQERSLKTCSLDHCTRRKLYDSTFFNFCSTEGCCMFIRGQALYPAGEKNEDDSGLFGSSTPASMAPTRCREHHRRKAHTSTEQGSKRLCLGGLRKASHKWHLS